MIQFIESPRFPDNIAYGASFENLFNTDSTSNQAGFVQVNINWDTPLFQAEVSHGVKTHDDIIKLKRFFWNTKGKAKGFRFKDWSDYKVDKSLSAVNEGEVLTSRVLKLYQVIPVENDVPSYRRIVKPVNASNYPSGTVKPFALYQNDVLVNSSNYIIDYTTGIVTLNNSFVFNEEDLFTFECEFDIPVRFTTDSFKANIESFNSYSWGNITVSEMREFQ